MGFTAGRSRARRDGAFVGATGEDRVATLGEEAVRFANVQADPASFESGENGGCGRPVRSCGRQGSR